MIEKNIFESVPSFDPNGLLWKMTFFQVRSESEGEFDYEVTIIFHHVIADTISGYNACLNLMRMIEIVTQNTQDETLYKEVSVLPCIEDLFYKQLADYEQFELPRAYRCKFFKNKLALEKWFNNDRYSILYQLKEESIIDVVNGQEYLKIRKAVEDSKNYKTRFRKVTMSKAKTKRLTDLCKLYELKMSTVFHLMVTQAFKILYKRYNEKERYALFNSSVSLRQFKNDLFGDFIENDRFGYCVGAITSFIDEDLTDIEDDKEWFDRFWQISKRESDKYHDQIKNQNLKFYKVRYSLEEEEINFHFVVTNAGRLKTSLNEDSLVRVTQSFTCDFVGNQEPITDRLVINLVSTVNDQVNWVVSFNSQIVQESTIQEILQIYDNLWEKILYDKLV
jgi:hypothetical protein